MERGARRWLGRDGGATVKEKVMSRAIEIFYSSLLPNGWLNNMERVPVVVAMLVKCMMNSWLANIWV